MPRQSNRKRRSGDKQIYIEEVEDEDDFIPLKTARRLSTASTSEETENAPLHANIEPSFRSKLQSLLQDSSKARKKLHGKENKNILTTINNAQNGWLRHRLSESIEEKARTSVVDALHHFAVYKTSSPFEKRITAIAWHPTQPDLFAVGNKWGSIVLWNYEKNDFNVYMDGLGPGGSIQNIKFHPTRPDWIYTCSIDGTMALKNPSKERDSNIKVFQSYDSYHYWYTAFDISFHNRLLACGNNKGTMKLMTSEGEDVVRSKHLHKGKIHDIRFSPREPWLMVSTSNDHSVKVWDVRNVKEKEPLASIIHNKAVNSAVFSFVDGARILTTDQHSELRVYKSPQWTCQKIIDHPHRQFQHLTPIIATWHPLVDMIVVGRYPDPNFEGFVDGEARSIDLIDPDKGTVEYQMTSPSENRIASLNQFSPSGDALLSCTAGTINVWKNTFNKLNDDEQQEDVLSKQGTGSTISKWPKGAKGRTQKKKKANNSKKSKQ
uniref:DNA damage-binding protein 2 n=1 Tax=Caligus clemensi TaxID=344056 RepID=C1C0W4_CALCM|nr:DNA damage-binding protein 2 [Caligus clemensi]